MQNNQRRITARLALVGAFLLPFLLGAQCGSGGEGASVSLTLNAVSEDLNGLLIVPPSGFVIQASVTGSEQPPAVSNVQLLAIPWSNEPAIDLSSAVVLTSEGGVAVVPPGLALPTGTWTVLASAEIDGGLMVSADYAFAVRDYQNNPPIDTGQMIWLDFASDRDATPGPDFPVDLLEFGLGSTAAPVESAAAEAWAIQSVLDRVENAYYDSDPNGLGLDPIDVGFSDVDPGGPSVTRICVGGRSSSYPNLIGNVLIDYNNANKNSVECGTIPPTGVFSGALIQYASQSSFKAIFDPLRTVRGGTPVGEHPLDPVVMAPGFDPGTATAEEVARHDEIAAGVQAFADSLGSVIAHEAAHALGLVADGTPGVGLHGDSGSHNVTSDGVSTPAENYLMNVGGSFTFAELAGLQGEALPEFRPLNHAYLRDRVVQDPDVSELLWAPVITGIDPVVIPQGATLVTVTGNHFAGAPRLQLTDFSSLYELWAEAFVSSEEVTGYVLNTTIPPGTYYIVLENEDGQSTVSSISVEVLPR